jgi:hypothetical protein
LSQAQVALIGPKRRAFVITNLAIWEIGVHYFGAPLSPCAQDERLNS